MRQFRLRHTHITRLFAKGRFQSRFWEKIFHILDMIWHMIWWFWGAVIFALIINVLGSFVFSDVTTSKMDFTDPRTWTTTHFLQANASWVLPFFVLATLLTIFSLWAHHKHMREVRQEEMNEYILKRVDHLNPSDYIFRYVRQIYVSREPDAVAREILHKAATDDTSSLQKPLGICILGRPIQGKTRLAWDAMQAELSAWTFIMWPHDSQNPFDFTGQRGKRVVLWLDDIHKFANASKAPTLNDLPRQFANAGIHFVIVATCRDGDHEVQARKYLGDLLEHLTELRLTDITEQEAADLLSQLK